MPEVRTDFTKPACVTVESHQWVGSPQPGVERMLLDRHGGEKAVATTLVRYAPSSHFPAHDHPLGEEFVVAEGTFVDEHGRYPEGSYVRNPPGSRHTPYSDTGCTLFVKLRQFHPDDREPVMQNMRLSPPAEGSIRQELHRFRDEVVTAIAAAPGATLEFPAQALVQEIFVLDGRLHREDATLGPQAWLRLPAGSACSVVADAPTRLLHKTRPDFALP